MGSGDVCYFGGDVSRVVIQENRAKFDDGGRMKFDVVDLVSEGLEGVEGVIDTLQCARRKGGQSLLLVRHLMFHLTIEENLKALQKIERLSQGVGGVKYVLMSTHLKVSGEGGGRASKNMIIHTTTTLTLAPPSPLLPHPASKANENENEYLLYNGHKINLFEWPYCLKDAVDISKDGEEDLYIGLWDMGKEGLRRRRDNLGKKCL
jgi:hypothetical protein